MGGQCFPLKSQCWSLDFMLLCHFKYFHHLDSDFSSPATKWVFKLQPLIDNPVACPFHPSFFPFLGHKWDFPFMGHKWDYLSSFRIILCLWCNIIVHILTFAFTNIKKKTERDSDIENQLVAIIRKRNEVMHERGRRLKVTDYSV